MKSIITTISFVLAFLVSPLSADQFSPVEDPMGIQTNEEGVAIGGYDPVEYFNANAAVKGEAKYQCEYQGATWHFTSEENRDQFLAAPERFAPQYGGYCAHSVGQNKLVESNPQSFLIRDEKLYLYVNDSLTKRDQKKTEISFKKSKSKRDKNWLSFERTF